ncbi:uncharacterized protein BO95DRAFT_444758 [Aspergillus brunneoviolaceus CBS 621.78]|uniref:Uncharacterized protein n=1 Tax=Aspergillus brunneoviolaceus CBS 621.78 TaxID=1450534 RepID=A0ACD1G3M9_9EURO|nr:hypothetical protein BO95DRAFT_444758 [Aspergillus brunneoviolaceus CBS 621.78]RAH43792.1 hypothetical protein BO95DRAFT_444758 [Aspergillus brunneoviolaceus CBS 621.78]
MTNLYDIPAGLVTGIEDSALAAQIIVAVILAIAFYNSVELVVLLFLTFKKYRGLYFWSLLVSTVLGVMPSVVGPVLHFYSLGPLLLALLISNLGFYAMVPVQSLVLYSRLHLLLRNERRLRQILYLILLTTAILLPPTTVTTYGSAFVGTAPWNAAYQVIERAQVTGFCLLELLLSALYIREAVHVLWAGDPALLRRRRESGETDGGGGGGGSGGSGAGNVIYQLVAINFVIIALDVGLLVLEYVGLYYLQVALKSLVYSIKLKMEFAVLGRLITLTGRHAHREAPVARLEEPARVPDFVGAEYAAVDFTHPVRTSKPSMSSG